MESKLVVFKDKKIRRILLENEWYFAVVDVVAALTDCNKPRDYWSRLKKGEHSDEKEYMSEIFNTEGLILINNKVSCHV